VVDLAERIKLIGKSPEKKTMKAVHGAQLSTEDLGYGNLSLSGGNGNGSYCRALALEPKC
jgi:hypothetical protein